MFVLCVCLYGVCSNVRVCVHVGCNLCACVCMYVCNYVFDVCTKAYDHTTKYAIGFVATAGLAICGMLGCSLPSYIECIRDNTINQR